MKTLVHLFVGLALIFLSSSCKKDKVVLSERDQFIGAYSGTMTTMLESNYDIIDYNIVPVSKTIEKGNADDEIIVDRGTDFEFYTYVDGTIFLVPLHIKQLTIGRDGLAFGISLTGQGVLVQNKELTITETGTENYDDLVFKWTITQELKKNTETKP